MYWILLVMAMLVSLVIAIVVGGLATPRRHIASRAIVFPKTTPDVVWNAIRNVDEYPDWRDDIRSIEHDRDAKANEWTELSNRGAISYIAVVDEAPTRFTARIADADLGYSGEWQYTLTAAGNGTRLVITEDGDVLNPVFRFLGAHFLGYTRSIDAFMRNLAVKFNERAQPVAVTD